MMDLPEGRRKKLLLALLLVVLGGLAAFQGLASTGTRCSAEGGPEDTFARCAGVERYQAWWSWPAMALGVAAVVAGLVMLAVEWLAARAERARRRGRRAA